jgi:hypothetical protein
MALLKALGLSARTPSPALASATAAGAGRSAPGDVDAGSGDPGDGDAERKVNVAKKLTVLLTPKYDEGIARAQKAIDAQPVAALKAMLEGEIATLRSSREEIGAMEPIAGSKRMSLVSSQAGTLAMRAEGMLTDGIEGKRELEQWGVKPLEALKKQVAALTGDPKKLFEPRIPILEGRLAEARVLLDKGDFDGLIRVAGPLKHACDAASKGITNFAKEYPDYREYRRRVVDMLARMKDKGLLDAGGLKAVADMQAAVEASDALGPIRGYLAAHAALKRIAERAKILRDSNEAYKDYRAEHERAEADVKALKGHKQAARLKSEIEDLVDRLKQADKLAKEPERGSLQALTALGVIRSDARELVALAGKIAKAEASLPALKKKLEAGGVDKKKMEKTANVALKLLVEEECSEDDAVKMAKDASGYADEGLEERDAIMSSRVKNSLEKEGVSAANAKAVGKNIRSGGTASAADAKAVASKLAKLPPKVIDNLNKAKIQTQCCRGGITDAMPELAGVLPRGWHETTTWDQVPGVYSSDDKKLVVGTHSGGGDKRDIGLDLVGHEAGHAFDASDGKPKREHKDFIAAREKDKKAAQTAIAAKAATIPGMYGVRDKGPDDYFLTEDEGGTNTAGAISETFADSFSRRTTGDTAWPNLMEFWQKNPWGV